MRSVHPLSFVVGFVCGLFVLFIVVGGMSLFTSSSTSVTTSSSRSTQQRGVGGGAGGLARMAERLGMTEAELQKELSAGKTIQDIAKEKGVTLPVGGGRRTGSGITAWRTGSGAVTGSGAMRSPRFRDDAGPMSASGALRARFVPAVSPASDSSTSSR